MIRQCYLMRFCCQSYSLRIKYYSAFFIIGALLLSSLLKEHVISNSKNVVDKIVHYKTITFASDNVGQEIDGIKSKRNAKLIVAGSTFCGLNKSWNEYFKKCKHKCIYSTNVALIPAADALMFYYNYKNTEQVLYNHSIHGRPSHQLFIAYSHESSITLHNYRKNTSAM